MVPVWGEASSKGNEKPTSAASCDRVGDTTAQFPNSAAPTMGFRCYTKCNVKRFVCMRGTRCTP